MLPYQSVDQNLKEAMSCYSFATEQGDVRHLPGVQISSSGINYAVFNSVMLTQPVESGLSEFEQRVVMGEVHFTAQGLGRSYWICEDLLPGRLRKTQEDRFTIHGMRCIAEPPGMLAERLERPKRVVPGLDFRQVDDRQTRFHFTEVVATVFALPFAVAERVYGSSSIWKSDMKGYVGYLAGKPLTIACSVVGGEAIGIYSVGTIPDYQGRGYAEAVMRFAVGEGTRATGLERTGLQTTRAGMRLYKGMGYEQVTEFRDYLRESCRSL